MRDFKTKSFIWICLSHPPPVVEDTFSWRWLLFRWCRCCCCCCCLTSSCCKQTLNIDLFVWYLFVKGSKYILPWEAHRTIFWIWATINITCLLVCLLACLIAWLLDCLNDWFIGWLIDSFIHWCTHYGVYITITLVKFAVSRDQQVCGTKSQRQCPRSNCFLFCF